jgi:predicted alpha/beta hydrolase
MRGSRFSLQHIALQSDVDKEDYWSHNWESAGRYDLPAVIDYITRVSEVEKIFYSGHSMGGTQFLAGMSERPGTGFTNISTIFLSFFFLSFF